MIIQVQEAGYFYGAEQVLKRVSFEIKEGERIGLIGRNGSGKTTVFRLISGLLTPTTGQIHRKKGLRIGLLEQVPVYTEKDTVYDVISASFAKLRNWQSELRQLEQLMSKPDIAAEEAKMTKILEKYGRLLEQFQLHGGYDMDARLNKIAAGLGISPSSYDKAFYTLSGGEKTKVGLASILVQAPDVLLLDEPTNHLDSAALEWLESYLVSYAGTVISISHDRYFLDAVVSKIIEIEDGEAVIYFTNYTNYQKEKEERLLREFAQYEEQQKKIRKMQETIKQLKDWGNRANPPNPSFHRRAASMEKALERMVKLKRPVLNQKTIGLSLEPSDRSGKQVLAVKEMGKRFNDRTLWEPADLDLRYGEHVAILGSNGSGKTTMLRAIIGGEPLDSGEVHWGSRVSIGVLAQEEHPPEQAMTVLQYFKERAEMEEGRARGELAKFLFYGTDAFKQVKQLSGGEWSRLRLAVLMHEQPNVLLLDEPTNHLDIDAREALEEALLDYSGTIVAISHDRYFINRLFGKLWILENKRWQVFIGNYDNYKNKEKAAAPINYKADAETGASQRSKHESSLRNSPKMPEPASKSSSAKAKSPEAVWSKRQPEGVDSKLLEESIVELESRLTELESDIAAYLEAGDPGVRTRDSADDEYEDKVQRYWSLKRELEMLYQQWMTDDLD